MAYMRYSIYAVTRNEWWGAGMSGAMCRFAYGPADATATATLAPVNPDCVYLSGTG